MRRFAAILGVLALGCGEDVLDVVPAPPEADLVAPAAELRPGDTHYSPQPHRDHPYAVALSAEGETAYVTLRGSEAEPGRHLAVVDTATLEVRGRIEVGSSPAGLALHPAGRFLVVANRYSSYLSVVDTRTAREVQRVAAPYYATSVAFRADGKKMWVSNRWLDGVQIYDVGEVGGRLELRLRQVPGARLRDRVRGMDAVPVGTNPRDIVVDEPSGHVFVANMPDLTISVIDIERDVEIDTDDDPETTDHGAPPGITRIDVRGPVNDLVVVGEWLFVATENAGTGHPAWDGPDTDGDGQPGDGTPNVNFQDVQNDIATWNARTLELGPRYTSDSLAGFYKDLPEGTPGLPAPEDRVVRGALPEQMAVLWRAERTQLAVTMSGSGEVAVFDVGPGPALQAADLFQVGFAPFGIAASPDGESIVVANRLSEDVARVEIASRAVERVVVGDVSGGPFPATDAEIGELYNAMTALFSADGDQACEHCHRDGNSIRKTHSMPLQRSVFGTRMIPTHRNLLRTRPLFFENALDEDNFIPVMNEFAREENFGFGRPRDDFADRNAFFVETSFRLIGRRTSFGDAGGLRLLDFNGMARMLGIFLLVEPRLLPNPNRGGTYATERGRVLFESTDTSCAVCHPAPVFAASDDFNPFGVATAMQVVSANTYAGRNADTLASGFITLFGGDHDAFSIPSLRGLWDRPAMFLHDGRALSLLETLATPGHPALGPDQRGFNERDGVPNLHGGTSHLAPEDLRDLIEYLMSIE